MNSLETVLHFINTGEVINHENVFYNETRDQSHARISRWIQFFKKYQINDHDSIILGAILGELTNNSFDHNLGQWRDSPGCIVGFEITDDILKIIIVDRGQGIISSLGNTLKNSDPQTILQKAFYEKVSGRAPEKRGNGLKFVLKHIQEKNSYLLCITQNEKIEIGNKRTETTFIKDLPKDFSTLIYLEWGIK